MDEPAPHRSLRLQVAAPDDWRAWRDLRRRALTADPDAFGSALEWEEGYTEEDWRARLRGGCSLLALLDGVPVGMGGSRPSEPGWLDVVAMWVAPEARGQGAGAAILAAVLADAAATGSRVRLWVADGNPARRLYERAGFVATGERRPIRPGAALAKSRMVLDAEAHPSPR